MIFSPVYLLADLSIIESMVKRISPIEPNTKWMEFFSWCGDMKYR